MSVKDSLAKSFMPQTVRHYRNAQTLVFHYDDVYVPRQRYPQFLRLERSLFKNGIMSNDYALGLSEALKGWVSKQEWPCLPMNIFCGSWAVAYFVENVGNRQYIAPDSKEEQTSLLVYDELLVARMYISNSGQMSFADAAELLDPALSPAWKYLYRSKRRTVVKIMALDTLCEEYGRYAIRYDDFIEEANDRCLSVQ